MRKEGNIFGMGFAGWGKFAGGDTNPNKSSLLKPIKIDFVNKSQTYPNAASANGLRLFYCVLNVAHLSHRPHLLCYCCLNRTQHLQSPIAISPLSKFPSGLLLIRMERNTMHHSKSHHRRIAPFSLIAE